MPCGARARAGEHAFRGPGGASGADGGGERYRRTQTRLRELEADDEDDDDEEEADRRHFSLLMTGAMHGEPNDEFSQMPPRPLRQARGVATEIIAEAEQRRDRMLSQAL